MEPVEKRVAGNRGTVAHNVRTFRRGRDWTQEQLAERAGVSRATVAKIETGEGDVNLSVLSRLAWALGVLTLTLLSGTGSGYEEDSDINDLLDTLDRQ